MPDPNTTNTKWALVTGASARGGAAISRRLHAEGCGVVLHHSPRSVEAATRLHDELEAARPGSARLWCADFAGGQPPALPDELTALGIAVCVCNASAYEPSTLEDMARARVDWSVHVLSHAAILAALRPRLRAVVAISDIHVERPDPGYVWYTLTKAALQSMVLTLSREWAPEVRCNVIQPGALPLPEGWGEARTQAVLSSIPAGRLGRFEELAETVAWLALRADYVTGQVIAVDGGRGRWLP